MKSLRVSLLAFLVFLQLAFAQQESRLSFLTFNAGLLSMPIIGDLVADVDSRAKALPAALNEFILKNAPDIILLEEVWKKDHQNLVKAKLESLGYQVKIPQVKKDFAVVNAGYAGSTGLIFAIKESSIELQSFEIESFAKHDLEAGYEKFASKGIIFSHVLVKSTGTPILVVGTHTAALEVNPDGTSKDSEAAKKLEEINAGQISLAVGKANDGIRPGELMAIMGDFNVGPELGAKNFQMLETLVGARAFLPAGPTWDQSNYLIKNGKFPNDPSAVIDHILVRKNEVASFNPQNISLVFTDGVVNKKSKDGDFKIPLSDHYGLFVEGNLSSTVR